QMGVSLIRDHNDNPLYYVGQFIDITSQLQAEAVLQERQEQLEALNRELEKMARTDALTGLSNRRHFMEQLDKEILRSVRNNQPLSLILVDVDHFKQYNDAYGHPEG